MITKTNVDGKLIIEIDQFLTPQECDEMLNERIECFEKAITHYPKYYRNNNRIEENNELLAKRLFERIKPLSIQELGKVKRLNEKLRFCQYSSNQEFTKHQDGVYYPNSTEASSLTFLLYLNDQDEFEGGQTQFFESKDSETPILEIIPKKGKLVIFDHTLWHKGNLVLKGEKYILRSDFISDYNSGEEEHQGYIWCLIKLKDNTFLSAGRDTIIRQWNESLELINSFKIHKKSVIKIVNLGNNRFASCSRDMTIKTWGIKGDVERSIDVDHMVLTMGMMDDLLVTGNTNGEITILSNKLEVIDQFKVHNGWLWDICIKDGVVYSVAEDGRLMATNLNGETKTFLENNCGLFSIVIKGEKIYCGSMTGELITINQEDKSIKRRQIHTDIIRRIVVDDDRIITCGEDNNVKVDGKTVSEHSNFVHDLIVMNDKIISAGFDGKIKVNKISLFAY
jgi:WD40 repeat protein